MNSLDFNKKDPKVMHIDLNSCFATIEQQANPFLRGKPIAVVAYDSPGGCILAPSIEAKRYGVKTGMRLKDGRTLVPGLISMMPDPNKYRHVHKQLRSIFVDYTNDFYPKSIDEFVLHMSGMPAVFEKGMRGSAQEIKQRIKQQIGEWLTVSVGISTNRFLAKVASNLRKPDGLELVDHKNFLKVYKSLELTDLPGIAHRNRARLESVGIFTVLDFYESPLWKLKAAFKSVTSYYWFTRLRGHEIDEVEFARKSYGNSYALPHSDGTVAELLPILQNLCEKTGSRMRSAGYKARGIYLSLHFRTQGYWHMSQRLNKNIFDSRDIYKEAARILRKCPNIYPVHTVAVSCFDLAGNKNLQLELFNDAERSRRLVCAIDQINERWGLMSVKPASILNMEKPMHDRISFGGVKEL